MTDPPDPGPDLETVFARYEALRDRLPGAAFDTEPQLAATLEDVADRFDGFVLDAFGVLNLGETPIRGAVARMARLRAMGKRLCVLTNAASYPRAAAEARLRRLGFDFAADEVVSSRDIAAAQLHAIAPGALWAAICAEGDDFADIPALVADAMAAPELLVRADAILFLSAARWTEAWQDRLVSAIEALPRPVVIANPDLVAPREGRLTIEPGWWGHDLADRTGQMPHFFGKPYGDAFTAARIRLGPGRHAMVGDTLHTDILGGRAAGVRTVLVAGHGLFAGHDVAPFIARSGIRPDAIVATT
ncbi:HAD-IIA family hydrolase [Rhodovulum steppense]|uniref:HAD superfamily hydrolase (TIGR01459 family) n=1 Tax=Rhodovulum steppense TaxID=540251 RepID=A0A4R1Z363_9RHOB|nr:HAD hydrolase-like protein [Rhodovulum steppense]TCM88119.1 HAD superfamily hydrolase (TIGR01459 family) [Rhodovulum steppense]